MQALIDGLRNIGESIGFFFHSLLSFVEWIPTILDTILSLLSFVPSFFGAVALVIGLIYLIKGVIGGDTQ